MTHDHIKRFSLSAKQPRADFHRSADAPIIKTKDNAQPVIPPPRTTFLPHPQLAPPGMMGSRLAKDAAQWRSRPAAPEPQVTFKPPVPKIRVRNQFEMSDIPFKPLVRDPDKSRGPDR